MFFANKFGAGFMVQARFGAEILLHSHSMAQNQRIFTAISSFFLTSSISQEIQFKILVKCLLCA